MRISKQSRREAKQLFRSCLVNGTLDSARVREIVGLVAKARPRGYVKILEHFQRLMKLELDRRTARVESVMPLSAELEADVKARLNGLHGPGLEFEFARNPELIGGLRVKVGSDVYDGSVRGRLSALQEQFEKPI